jgi:hypothetical protein
MGERSICGGYISERSMRQMPFIPNYKVTGCEDDAYNDTFWYSETTGNGDVWWRSRRFDKMLRHSPGWGWRLGWYTHSSNSDIAPIDGWTFNGGQCDPPNLGERIAIRRG